MKKAISALTALVLTFTVFMGAIPIGAEESRSDGQASLENDISVTGTNSFGNLLSDELSEKVDEQQQNNGCNIFSAEVTGNKADVSFETVESCTLLVVIYDESGEQMLASGSMEVTTDETEKTVTIETESMPKYFYLRAFLVDTNTLRPICTAYESPNYTREMQEFFAKTVDDFDSEKVLNLDEDKSNNFAVYGEDTKVIESDGVVNKVTKSDEENGIYVIENADSSVTALAKDDVFALAQPDGNVLIAKIDAIKVSGKTVTITDQDTSMEEVFDYVKIDESQGLENAIIDDSTLDEDVIYNGMVEDTPESRTYSQENTYNSNEAYLPAGPEYRDLEISGKGEKSRSYSFLDKTIGNEDNNVTLSGGMDLKAVGTVKLYSSDTYKYLEVKLDLSAKISASLSAKSSVRKSLEGITIPINAAVSIVFKPTFIFEASGEFEITGTLTTTIGIKVSNDEGIKNISSAPKFRSEVKAEAKAFIGLSLETKAVVIHEKVAGAGLEAIVGAEINASMEKKEIDIDADTKHECNACIDGEINARFNLFAKASLLDIWKFSARLLNYKIKLCDFYYSFDKNEFGWGSCPYEKYKVSICVKDEKGNPVSGAEITARGTSDNVSGETDENGRFETWLSNDNWSTLASKGDKYAFKVLTINEPKNVAITLRLNSDPDNPDNSNSGGLWNGVWGGSKPIRPSISVESQRLSLGVGHSGYIDDNGSLYMWGYNDSGQLGNGTTKYSDEPIKIMDNVKSVSLGTFHSAAITEDGSLYMWGHNSKGQLGNGTKTDSSTPIKIMSNVKAVSLGSEHSAAITNDGSLYMWGYKLGNGTTKNSLTPIKIMDNVKAVSLGGYHSAAITEYGSLYMWGNNIYGQLGNGKSGYDKSRSTPIKIMDNVKEVSLGMYHSAAITNDGSLYMWGNNNSGQIGNGTTENSSTPIKIMNNVKAVSLGWNHLGNHSAVITEDGNLYMWGENYDGQLGNGKSKGDYFEYDEGVDSLTPIKIMDNVKSVSLGNEHSAAITDDGSLYMWGGNGNGQLGNGTLQDSSTPIKITIPSASARTIPSTSYLAEEPTLQTEEFTGLLPNEVYNFYSVLNNELLYVSQGVSDKNGNLDISYIPKKDDTGADIFLKGMTRTDISGAEVTVPDILCNGEEQFAQPVVTLDGVTLSEADYDIALQYSAVYPGEYDVTIVGTGDYTGEVEAVYNVYCEHSFSDGKCTICKSLEGTVGDVNEDGAVGVADIVALQRFIVCKKTAFPKNGDVNGDGAVNIFDVVELKKILLNA